MGEHTALVMTSHDPAPVTPSVDWRTTLDTFLNTLSSPRTMQAYERAVVEAMEAMGVDFVAELNPPILAEYRAGLVTRLDTEGEGRLSPSTVNLRLGALHSLLRFCWLTGVPPARI